MSQKLNHALHNEEVLNFLCTDTHNVDWIITTAFYSALHFLEYKIFPYTAQTTAGKKYKIHSFDDYCSHLYPLQKVNKHAIRLLIVNKEHPAIAANYKWLKDACWTARYYNYKYKNEQLYINAAKKHLDAIRQYCI